MTLLTIATRGANCLHHSEIPAQGHRVAEKVVRSPVVGGQLAQVTPGPGVVEMRRARVGGDVVVTDLPHQQEQVRHRDREAELIADLRRGGPAMELGDGRLERVRCGRCNHEGEQQQGRNQNRDAWLHEKRGSGVEKILLRSRKEALASRMGQEDEPPTARQRGRRSGRMPDALLGGD
jgi:hypothetical protein